MKTTFAILLATTAVVGGLGSPALSAFGRDSGHTANSAFIGGKPSEGAIVLASNDDDSREEARRDDVDDHDDDDDDDECDDEDEDECRHPSPALIPTAPVAPPANGLFSPGTLPQVRTN